MAGQTYGGRRTGFCNFLYDRETKLVMGRTGKQWLQLITFYIIFYGALVGFWIACLMGFLATTNERLPTLTGFQSMLRLNPAIGYRPQPDFESNLIKFDASKKDTYATYLKDSNSFLEQYYNSTLQSQLLDCSGDKVATRDQGCRFRPEIDANSTGCFAEGKPPFGLGFASASPCIILKMNRIIGWLPRNNGSKFDDIKVRCEGENDADKENLGEVEYSPGGRDANGNYGILQAKYFPFMNQPYLSPFVVARFKNIKPYTITLIWCEFDKAEMNFAPDVYSVSRLLSERSGGAHFELLVDRAPGNSSVSN